MDYSAHTIYLASNIRPKKEDMVFDIAEASWIRMPTRANVKRAYDVEAVDPKYDGKLIFTALELQIRNAIRDESMVNPIAIDTSFARLVT